MEKSLKDRFVNLSKALIVFFVIAGIVFINKQRTTELGTQLAVLEKAQRISSSINNGQNIDTLFRNWLESHNRPLYDRHIQLRRAITAFFEKSGFKDFTRMKINKELLFFLSVTERQPLSVGITGYQLRDKPSIPFVLENIRRYNSDPIKHYLAISIDTNVLKAKLDSTVHALKSRTDIDPEEKGLFRISNVKLARDESAIETHISHHAFGQVQSEVMEIPCRMDSITITSENFLSPLQDTLTSSELQLLNNLNRLYQNLPISEIATSIGKDYSRGYQDVSLLGFTFSTTLFPLFLIFFLLCIAIAFLVNLRLIGNFSLFTSNLLDNVFEPIVNITWLRFTIWIICPLLSIYFSLPLSSLTTFAMVIAVSAAVALLAIQGYCFFKTLRPSTTTTAATATGQPTGG